MTANCRQIARFHVVPARRKTAAPMLEQIEEGKKTIGRTMSPQQLAEAEGRAAAWLRNAKKQPGFAGDGKVQAGGQRKMRLGAR
jgi:hypothetical protein